MNILRNALLLQKGIGDSRARKVRDRKEGGREGVGSGSVHGISYLPAVLP
jgi:hypothetical protein